MKEDPVIFQLKEAFFFFLVPVSAADNPLTLLLGLTELDLLLPGTLVDLSDLLLLLLT